MPMNPSANVTPHESYTKPYKQPRRMPPLTGFYKLIKCCEYVRFYKYSYGSCKIQIINQRTYPLFWALARRGELFGNYNSVPFDYEIRTAML